MARFPSTLLPTSNEPEEIRKALLDLLSKLNEIYSATSVEASGESSSEVGSIIQSAAIDTPSGYLLCDGTGLSRTAYAGLYGKITKSLGPCTLPAASPGVVSLAGHGLITGDRVEFSTTGNLPTGVAAYTNYYVIYLTSGTFSLASSYANAIAGTAINFTGSPSGVHTCRHIPFGTGSSVLFSLPDFREASPYGIGTRGAGVTAHDSAPLGAFFDDQLQGHYHRSGSLGTFATTGAVRALRGNDSSTADRYTLEATSDGTNGTPRLGTVTRGKIIGIKFFIRYL